MGLFSIFKRKDPRINYDFDNSDRDLSIALRQKSAKLKELEQERRATLAQIELEKAQYELAELRRDLSDDDDDDAPSDPMSALVPVILAKFLGGQNNPPIAKDNTTSLPVDSKVELTDMQIEDVVRQLDKKHIKYILKLNKETAFSLAKAQFGNITDTSLERLYAALQAQG